MQDNQLALGLQCALFVWNDSLLVADPNEAVVIIRENLKYLYYWIRAPWSSQSAKDGVASYKLKFTEYPF